MYADDTTISHSSKYFSILEEDLNRDLVKLQNWLHGNELSFNVTKAQSLITGSRPNILKVDKKNGVKSCLESEEQKILMVNDIKLFRVKIDDKLRWGDQVEQAEAKAVQSLGLIKHAKKFLSIK